MNRRPHISIDHLDLSLDGLDTATAEGVRAELPAALQCRLAIRMADAATGWTVQTAAAHLGTLDLPPGQTARAVADAIADRLGDWLQRQAETRGST